MEATQYPSTDDWINNMGNTHEMEYDPALKSKDILTLARHD